MNEATKKLAGQALDKAVPYTWTKLDYEQIHELLACHAELIVEECMKVVINGKYSATECERNTHRIAHNNARDEASSDIKKHFGVKE